MLTGTKLELTSSTLAVAAMPDGRQQVITVPARSILTVISAPDNGTIEVSLDGKTVVMFLVDLRRRGKSIDI